MDLKNFCLPPMGSNSWKPIIILMYEEVWHFYLFVYDRIFLMWMTSKNSVSFENAFFNCLGCCNKTREFVFADINMFWARLRLNFTWAARRGLKWALRRAQNIVYEREYKLHYYHFRGHKTEKVTKFSSVLGWAQLYG